MSTQDLFLRYAADFEKSFADDDWSRIEPYFGPDSVYRIVSSRYGGELVGPAAIVAGMKKSVDGLDRVFDRREIGIDEGPTVDGDTLRVAWTVTYTIGDHRPFALVGASEARVDGETIAELQDTFGDEMNDAIDAWQAETGVSFDPSYR